MFGWFFDTEQEEQVLDGTHEYYRKDEDKNGEEIECVEQCMN